MRVWAIGDEIPGSDTNRGLPTHVLLGLITCYYMRVGTSAVLPIHLVRTRSINSALHLILSNACDYKLQVNQTLSESL